MNILIFIAVLIVLIVVHELGHFLIAKLFKVRVDEFGVGYPPRAFTIGRIGETEYTINWIPFGGFVRIFGETKDDSISDAEKKRALVYKNPFVQIAVLAGGVLFNMIFAWILFSATFMLGAPASVAESQYGVQPTRLLISSIIPSTPASMSDLKAGDEIHLLESNSKTHKDKITKITPSAVAEFIKRHKGEELLFTVTHLGSTTKAIVPITPVQGILKDSPGTPAVGIAMNLVTDEPMGFLSALKYGADATLGSFVMVYNGLVKLFSSAFMGNVDWKQVAGPVGIVGIVGQASSIGMIYLLNVVAFISVNLALVNLIPIPALDGGRILFVLIEAIIRRPLPGFITTTLNVAGFGALILFMLFITYHDILKLLS